MEARDAFRKSPLLKECQGAPEMFAQVLPRLYTFMKPCVNAFHGEAAVQHATISVGGLLADVARTNSASRASRFGPSRLPLQGGMGWDAWDDAPVREAWRSQVTTPGGPGDGVVGCDPAGCPKSGRESVGVARQWCGRLGQVANCPVALALGDVSRKGHTLGDTRRSLPQAWTKEQARLATAGVPTAERAERTRHQWALERRENTGAERPHRWMAGDDEMGRPSWCRRRREAVGERDRLAVPAHPSRRDVEGEPPASSGRGRHPKRPWPPVAAWSQSLEDAAWQRRDVRDGRQGPLGMEALKRRVGSRPHRRQQGAQETLGVIRSRDRDHEQVVKVDDSLAKAAPETPLGACARVATAAHRLAACLQRSQSEAGVSDDEVRHWTGWQHHQTLS